MKTLIGILVSLLVLSSCGLDSPEMIVLAGQAQGTSFRVQYYGDEAEDYSEEVALVLNDIDKSMSLWRDDSFITQLNSSQDSIFQIPKDDEHFIPVFKEATQIFRRSDAAFDPSIYPLVRAWGFGAIPPDSDSIPNVDSLLNAHGIGEWQMKVAEVGPDMVFFKPPKVQLDFNGIAQGYSVDALAALLDDKGLTNYMVEIGGELYSKGSKMDGSTWTVAIEKPIEGESQELTRLALVDQAVATSGSYRKYLERNGKRYSHCIDPRTGYPVGHTLLSVTVVAPTCMEADAYATAFLVMGVKPTLERLERGLGSKLEVLMVYDDNGENKLIGTGRFKDLVQASSF